MPTPIIFGVLLHDADEEWLGRNQLMLALSAHTNVVLLEQPRFSGRWIEFRKPRPEQVGENLFVIRDAFGLRYQRLGKRLKKLHGQTPYEFVCAQFAQNPGIFIRHPTHDFPGLYT